MEIKRAVKDDERIEKWNGNALYWNSNDQREDDLRRDKNQSGGAQTGDRRDVSQKGTAKVSTKIPSFAPMRQDDQLNTYHLNFKKYTNANEVQTRLDMTPSTTPEGSDERRILDGNKGAVWRLCSVQGDTSQKAGADQIRIPRW